MIAKRRIRPGFTMTEMIIVSILMSLLSILIGSVWMSLGRAAWETIHRTRLTEEAELVASALATDLAGFLPEASVATSPRDRYRLVGRGQPGGHSLWLCFDGDDPADGLASWASPDVVIAYTLSGDRLVRSNEHTSGTTVLANHVTGFSVTDLGTAVQIDLDLSSRGFTSTYRFIAQDPP